MIVAFENIKHIYQYRTPRTLGAFSDFFVLVLPVVYGPYFAAISKDFSPELVYVMPVLFTLILVSLDNIQSHLENPFDQIGEDDIIINAEKFVERPDLGDYRVADSGSPHRAAATHKELQESRARTRTVSSKP